MRVSCFYSVLLSLSCVLVYSASDSAPIFFFALPKKKMVAGGQKKKGALYGQDKDTIQPGFQVTAGAYRASSEGLCAFPDAQPLTLAVCAAWQSHWRSASCGRTLKKFRRAVSANLGESKGAAPPDLKRLFGFFHLRVCTFSASFTSLQAVFAPFFFSQKEESRNAVKKEKVGVI